MSWQRKQIVMVIQSVLFEQWLNGNNNWLADYTLRELAKAKGVLAKENTFRRVALDMAKQGLIQKFGRKSLYKWRDAHNLHSSFHELVRNQKEENSVWENVAGQQAWPQASAGWPPKNKTELVRI